MATATQIDGLRQILQKTIDHTRLSDAAGIVLGQLAQGSLIILSDGSVAMAANWSMGSHRITNVTDPTAAQDAATKNYVDLATAALAPKNDCQAATTTGLAAYTYNNGSSGVGATITLTVSAVLVLDGYTPALNDRLLIKNETGGNAPYNGLYSLTTVGVLGVTQAVLTRTLDFDQPGDGINGALVYILNGTVNGNTLWSCTTSGTIAFGTTNINWTKFLGSTYTADETTLHLAGTTFSIISTYTGQTSITTLGTIATGTWAGTTIAVNHGGTGLATLTAHAVVIGEGTGNVAFATTGTAGQVLIDQGSGADPSFNAISGSGATFTLSAAGVLTISSIANASLANSSINVIAGTNMTGGGTVSLGGSVTLNATGGSFTNPMTTEGDMIFQLAGTATRLPLGPQASLLQSNGVDPTYVLKLDCGQW